MRKTSGFTLIELMIVLAIIGILAAVIYPALTGKGRRSVDGFGHTSGEVVQDQPRSGDNTQCVGGIAHMRGQPIIVNGNTVKC